MPGLPGQSRITQSLFAGLQIILPGEKPPAEPVDLLIDTVGGPGLPERLRSVRRGGRVRGVEGCRRVENGP